jgi:hypothetical protein
MAGYQGTSTRRDDIEAFASGSEADRRDLVTAVKATATGYDASLQKGTFKPAYRQKIGGKMIEAPDLLDVPVHHLRGGGYVLHLPVKANDAVTLVALSRPLDNWQADGSAHDGAPGLMHDWSNMVALPGGAPDNKALPASVTSGYFSGSDDGKRGLAVDDSGKTALRGGPGGTDKLVITPAGKVDLKGENGDGLMAIIKDLATIYRDHVNASQPMNSPDIAAANAIIARIDAIKS